jgi:hypothetical protein
MTAKELAATARTEDDKAWSILPLFVATLLIPAALGSSQTIFNDGDVSWHLATGLWILDHRAIPHADPFSFTWAGKPWTAMEWLADIIYASGYRLGGYGGVAAIVTAALMALHAIVYCNMSRFVRPVIAVAGLIAMDLALIPMMLARPHTLAWPIAALWLWVLMRAREHDRAPSLWWSLLIILWSNLHASVVMGLVIAGIFGLEALVASADRAPAFRQWSIFGVACVAAFFVNANGLDALLYPLHIAHLKILPLIDEWKPSNPKITPFFFGVLALTMALIAWKRPRLHWMRWLLLAALLALALLQIRHQSIFAIVAAMVLPQGFARPEGEERKADRDFAGLATAGAVLLVSLRAILPLTPLDNEANPWRLIASVPLELRSQPVLNGYSMGGPLILAGIRPYIDGRSDMYGDDLVLGYLRITRGDPRAFTDAVQRWNIRWAIFPNSKTGIVALLDRTPGWRKIRQDKVGVVYVRE